MFDPVALNRRRRKGVFVDCSGKSDNIETFIESLMMHQQLLSLQIGSEMTSERRLDEKRKYLC